MGTLLAGWGLVLASLETLGPSLLLAPGVLGALGILSYSERGSLMAGLTIGTLSPGPGLGPGLTLGSVSRTMTLTLDR